MTFKLLIISLILLPSISFGQLFPTVMEPKGDIEQVIETFYGRKIPIFNKWSGIYIARLRSDWTHTYYYDEKGRIQRQVNTFKGDVRADYTFEYFATNNSFTVRQIRNDTVNNQIGRYSETEHIYGKNGLIKKVKYRSFKPNDSSGNVFIIEENARYDSLNRLISFYRPFTHNLNHEDENPAGSRFVIYYDSLSRVKRIEEQAVGVISEFVLSEKDSGTIVSRKRLISEPELLRSWTYKYNSKGQIAERSIENFTDPHSLFDYNPKTYTYYYKYDKTGNWVKAYLRADDSRKRLHSKRKIQYR